MDNFNTELIKKIYPSVEIKTDRNNNNNEALDYGIINNYDEEDIIEYKFSKNK